MPLAPRFLVLATTIVLRNKTGAMHSAPASYITEFYFPFPIEHMEFAPPIGNADLIGCDFLKIIYAYITKISDSTAKNFGCRLGEIVCTSLPFAVSSFRYRQPTTS
jgi:hypothetical protein